MKVIREKTIVIRYLAPETKEEEAELHRIIAEVTEEKIDPASFQRMEPGESVPD
jgi:hypothetical protein